MREFLGNYQSVASKASEWEQQLKDDPDKAFLLAGIQNGFRITNKGCKIAKRQRITNPLPCIPVGHWWKKELKTQTERELCHSERKASHNQPLGCRPQRWWVSASYSWWQSTGGFWYEWVYWSPFSALSNSTGWQSTGGFCHEQVYWSPFSVLSNSTRWQSTGGFCHEQVYWSPFNALSNSTGRQSTGGFCHEQVYWSPFSALSNSTGCLSSGQTRVLLC